MFLAKPIFSTKGTIVEKKVLQNNMGYVSDEKEEDILAVISRIDIDDALEKGENANKVWRETFCDYTRRYLEGEYLELKKLM